MFKLPWICTRKQITPPPPSTNILTHVIRVNLYFLQNINFAYQIWTPNRLPGSETFQIW